MATPIHKIQVDQPEEKYIKEAARIIREGGLVIFLTETV